MICMKTAFLLKNGYDLTNLVCNVDFNNWTSRQYLRLLQNRLYQRKYKTHTIVNPIVFNLRLRYT